MTDTTLIVLLGLVAIAIASLGGALILWPLAKKLGKIPNASFKNSYLVCFTSSAICLGVWAFLVSQPDLLVSLVVPEGYATTAVEGLIDEGRADPGHRAEVVEHYDRALRSSSDLRNSVHEHGSFKAASYADMLIPSTRNILILHITLLAIAYTIMGRFIWRTTWLSSLKANAPWLLIAAGASVYAMSAFTSSVQV